MCPGKVGHPYQVHFGERLYEKQVDRSSQVNNVRAWSDCRHRVEPAGRAKCLFGEKLVRLGE